MSQTEMNNNQKKVLPVTAFILAGGVGSRLKSVVSDRPKPMAPIGDKPFLAILIEFLVQKGINKIVLLTGYMSEHIEEHINNYRNSNVDVLVSREESPLGTGGAVRNALKFASDPTLLVNGDTYFEADILELYNFHLHNHGDVTLSLRRVADVGRYGSVMIESDGKVEDFQEKSELVCGSGLINAGFSMVSLGLIERLPAHKAFSMEKEIFPSLTSDGKMYGIEQQGTFFDIGTPDSYYQFMDYVAGLKRKPV